ncbi:alpha/beta fold hydrolase [Roseateles cavernae]|uniref:alpha/beta fold hydrolase n=1 Tax=Roseateles cavernae TaxID=3153578 RepID=UPI0032E4C4B6
MSEPVTWVLLRGLTREAGHWGAFPAVFTQEITAQQPGARVMTLDLPGNGALYREASPSRVPDMVEACRTELARRGQTGPVHLLAMSLGAMVACDWASRYPDEVGGTVLINTSLRPYSPFFHRLRPANYWKLLALGLLRLGVRWREARVLKMTSRMVTEPQPVLESWVALQRKHPVGVRNGVRQLLAAMRYRASRGRPHAPMLLLCSQADTLVDWRCSQSLSRAWGVPLRLHTQAGHDLPLDDPPWVARAVSDWLRARQMHASAGLGRT